MRDWLVFSVLLMVACGKDATDDVPAPDDAASGVDAADSGADTDAPDDVQLDSDADSPDADTADATGPDASPTGDVSDADETSSDVVTAETTGCDAPWTRICELIFAEDCQEPWTDFFRETLPSIIDDVDAASCAEYMVRTQCSAVQLSVSRGFISLGPAPEIAACREELLVASCEYYGESSGDCLEDLWIPQQESGDDCFTWSDCVEESDICVTRRPGQLDSGEFIGSCRPPVEEGGDCSSSFECEPGLECQRQVCRVPMP
jgi:hypothetical protein